MRDGNLLRVVRERMQRRCEPRIRSWRDGAGRVVAGEVETGHRSALFGRIRPGRAGEGSAPLLRSLGARAARG